MALEATGQTMPPSPTERRLRSRQVMLEAVLTAARTVMRDKGVAGLNLNDVAGLVGIKSPSLYNYFPGKGALYDALFRLGFRLARERREVALQAHPPSWEQLRAWLESHMQFAQEYPELYQLCFEHPVPGFAPSAESMEESRRLHRVSMQAMAELIDAGVVDSGIPVEQTLDVFIVVMHGLTSLHLANDLDLPVGAGRFGGLVPEVLAPLQACWAPKHQERDP